MFCGHYGGWLGLTCRVCMCVCVSASVLFVCVSFSRPRVGILLSVWAEVKIQHRYTALCSAVADKQSECVCTCICVLVLKCVPFDCVCAQQRFLLNTHRKVQCEIHSRQRKTKLNRKIKRSFRNDNERGNCHKATSRFFRTMEVIQNDDNKSKQILFRAVWSILNLVSTSTPPAVSFYFQKTHQETLENL